MGHRYGHREAITAAVLLVEALLGLILPPLLAERQAAASMVLEYDGLAHHLRHQRRLRYHNLPVE